MQCPACGEANRPGRLYCARCGASITIACGACGGRNEAGEQFCGQCGRRLDAAASPASHAGSGSVPPPSRAPSAPAVPLTAVAPFASLADGRYLVGRLLGEGAKKRVFLGTDTRLERDVAIALVKT